MSKGKQTTLFQSWGPSKQTSKTGKPDTGGKVVDLCDDDYDDDILAQVTDETLGLIDKYGEQPTASTSHTGHHDNTDTVDQSDVCNISLGAESFQSSGLSQMEVPEGFDRSAGKLWIYPTNYPVREYQYNIVQQALFKNTMVTLPTGLGKTFIASVVMYNFYRWYPQGKVIFMAPTKPLVAQQIEACYNVMGIQQDHTAEMTGTMVPDERRKAWHTRRVFFLTPQVLTNDLSRGTCPAEQVKCLVIDEAHKAQGNHAYCQVVRELIKYTKNFRILALSATPGSDIKAVQQVLVNLLISHIELRTEDSSDIKRYSHERKVEKIVVPLGDELTTVRNKYLQIVELVVNRLKRQGVLYARNTTSLSKFLILKARDAFRQNPPQQLPQAQYGGVEGDFALAMSLYHGLELLQLHGQRSLYNFLDGIVNGEKGYGRTRTELMKNACFTDLMQNLAQKFTPGDQRPSQVPPSQRKPFVAGHPKMLKLEEVVLSHFRSMCKDEKEGSVATRIMIFSQYRDSVTEITNMLKQHWPMVKAMSFIGQSSAGKSTKGFTQKEQLKVMKEFREGGYNTLISTCVGEEGLDIGEVDLIICFDAHKSPIRLVQRMGRTGRKREGRIVMLVTEGKEEQIYNQSQYSKKSIHKAILNGAKSLQFYSGNPRMVPDNWTPACHKMYITVTQSFMPARPTIGQGKTKQPKVSSVMERKGRSKADQDDGFLTDAEAREVEEKFSDVTARELPGHKPMLCLGEQANSFEAKGDALSLTEWIPWQNSLQPTHFVQHSRKTKNFVELMQFLELQNQQNDTEDRYGNEMEMFLNEEDIIKVQDDMEAGQDETGKPRNTVVDMTLIGTKKNRTKVRRSETLPRFDSEEDSDSSESLPAVEFINTDLKPSTTGNKTKTYSVSDNDIDEKGANKIELFAKPEKSQIKRKSSVSRKERSSCLEKFYVKNKKNSTSVSPKLRKNKKSIPVINTTVVEVIEDNDSNDFEVPGPTVDTNEGLQESRPGTSEDLQKAECVIDVSSQQKMCHRESEIEDKITDIFDRILPAFPSFCNREAPRLQDLTGCLESVPSPPSTDDVDSQMRCLENLEQLPPLDLLQLVDEWEKENRNRTIKTECHEDVDSNTSSCNVCFTSVTNSSSALVYQHEEENKDLSSSSKKPKVSIPAENLAFSKVKDISANEEQKNIVNSVNDICCSNPTKDAGILQEKVTGELNDIEMSDDSDFELSTQVTSPRHFKRSQRSKRILRKAPSDVDNQSNGKQGQKTVSLSRFSDIISPEQGNLGRHDELQIANCKLAEDENVQAGESSDNCDPHTVKQVSKSMRRDNLCGLATANVSDMNCELLNRASEKDEDQCLSSDVSDMEDFVNTQATFMLASAADFLMNDLNQGGNGDIKQCDSVLHENKLETSDSLSLHILENVSSAKPIPVETEHSDKHSSKSLSWSSQTIGTETTETQFTFTQALACIHDSEEWQVENNTQKGIISPEVQQSKTEHIEDQLEGDACKILGTLEVLDEGHQSEDVSSSDSCDGDMFPSFDLGFNFDEDIIPPSPCASQLSQKSFSKSLSQTLLHGGRKSLASSFSTSLCGNIGENGPYRTDLEVVEEMSEMKGDELVSEDSTMDVDEIVGQPLEQTDYMNEKEIISSKKEGENENHGVSEKQTNEFKVEDLHSNSEDEEFEKQLTLAIEESLKNNNNEQDLPDNYDHLNISSHNASISDLDDSFIVKKRRRVAIIDSPVTPEFLSDKAPAVESEFKTPLKAPDFPSKKSKNSCSGKDSAFSKIKRKPAVSFNILDISNDSDDFDFDTSELKRKMIKKKTKGSHDYCPPRERKSPADAFIMDEADVSDEEQLSSDDYEGSELDRYEDSFVGEATQMSQRTTEEMQAVYLRSVRSPSVQGRFKLSYRHRDVDVFSQAPREEEEESQYLQDSFCVDEEEEDWEGDSDLGEVTLLHDVTCQGRRTRWSRPAVVQKPAKVNKTVSKQRRRRIKATEYSSSEEEDSGAKCVNRTFVDDYSIKKKRAGSRTIFSSESSDENAQLSFNKTNADVLVDQRDFGGNSRKISSKTTKENVTSSSRMNQLLEQDELPGPSEAKKCEALHLASDGTEGQSIKSPESSKEEAGKHGTNESSSDSFWITRPITDCDTDDKVVVIVDSREINGSQDIVSDLRFQHKFRVLAAQLDSCDYIVSNRMCIDRKQWAEFSNGANKEKLVERIQSMIQLYDKPCLIIEKDRVKGDDKGLRPLHWTKYVDKTLVQLVKSKVTLFFAENQKETANLISDLGNLEKRKNLSITVPTDLSVTKQEQLRFYLTVPNLNYVIALNLCHNFQTVSDFIRSSAQNIEVGGRMSRLRSQDVYNFLRRTFDNHI